MRLMDADEVAVARAVALIGPVEVPELDARVGPGARAVVDRLCARGLGWEVAGRVGLPGRLAGHLSNGLELLRPLAEIVRHSRVDDLRTAVTGLGGDPGGRTKAGLVEQLSALLADPEVVVRTVARLPAPAVRHLEMLLVGDGYFFVSGGVPPALVARGVLVGGQYGRPELPREVARAILLQTGDRITGRPELPAAADLPDDGRTAAESAVLTVTTLLDEARRKPLAALKKGGIGTRERARLAKLGVPEPALAIDVAFGAGLLAFSATGYGATADYDGWRADDLPARWAVLARTWFALDVAPTSRETDDGEVHPPLPLDSAGGMLRRALLTAAAGGRSLAAVRGHIEWFCPLHGYDDEGRDRKIAAALTEAELLGVVSGDRLTALGEALLAGRDLTDLLPETRGMLVLQSDLTALVSGQVSAAAARLLAACAVAESRGVAVTWRFTPASVRSALDDGWTADELRTELAAVSDRELPQPLDYLLGDVARRHGSVRVREVRSCVTGAGAELTEIRHTRSLAKLQLRAVAPTVLVSPCEVGEVVTRLRAAGFSPMPEDADGVVVLPSRAPGPLRSRPSAPVRSSVDAAHLAVELLATPAGPLLLDGVHAELARLAVHLDAAEVALLADALEHGRDVRISYRNKDGNRSVREIRPQELWDRWLTSWCHLRDGERDFAVAGIEAVALPG